VPAQIRQDELGGVTRMPVKNRNSGTCLGPVDRNGGGGLWAAAKAEPKEKRRKPSAGRSCKPPEPNLRREACYAAAPSCALGPPCRSRKTHCARRPALAPQTVHQRDQTAEALCEGV